MKVIWSIYPEHLHPIFTLEPPLTCKTFADDEDLVTSRNLASRDIDHRRGKAIRLIDRRELLHQTYNVQGR